MRNHQFIIGILFLCTACTTSNSPSVPAQPGEIINDSVKVIKSGLNYPWEILWGKDDHLWFTERGGKINKMDPRTGSIIFSYTLSEVVSNGEGGLLGMVQHPGFLQNGLFYVAYNYNSVSGYREKLVQMKYANNTITTVKTLLEDLAASSIHNGSRLWISADAHLFMTTGDASVQSNAQNTNSLNGKVLRLNLDGTIPADNPFPGSAIWSYGHRNQQAISPFRDLCIVIIIHRAYSDRSVTAAPDWFLYIIGTAESRFR